MRLDIRPDGTFIITGKIDPATVKESSTGKSMLHVYAPWGPGIQSDGSPALIDGKQATVTLTIATPVAKK